MTQEERVAFGWSLLSALLPTSHNQAQTMSMQSQPQRTTRAQQALTVFGRCITALCPASFDSINHHESSPILPMDYFHGSDWNGHRIRGESPLVANG